MNETEKHKSTIIGLVALLPLLLLIMFIVKFIELETTIKIILTLLVAASASYGWIKLAKPLAEESKQTGRLL